MAVKGELVNQPEQPINTLTHFHFVCIKFTWHSFFGIQVLLFEEILVVSM